MSSKACPGTGSVPNSYDSPTITTLFIFVYIYSIFYLLFNFLVLSTRVFEYLSILSICFDYEYGRPLGWERSVVAGRYRRRIITEYMDRELVTWSLNTTYPLKYLTVGSLEPGGLLVGREIKRYITIPRDTC
ncbi:hypothetical protein SODALDRAFT_84185 [Sodiomyces alkalinus F11]|uniref:Uncharacterized protein n=1 Tax=Sodiomyces alkalinus (strain CBS 110278 / VKM F-3762 / F11) TaxID=1314773 RepID=A0A3N2PJN8_SODAK|nr:hypothetical protein SODALDRAFT_84185 [Sodiomyces alkalinus F11]ROT34737.1 hypothetical protein SODALDRAFT_84185 [Sodiomyces alkalinus F11]